MKKHRLFRSLQTQLPLSFGILSLLTTTLIGIVMALTIWKYYNNLENRYLNDNLFGTANSISRIVQKSEISLGDSLLDYQDVFQNQARITAFLIQSRVRILDVTGYAVADSGSPSQSWNITVPRSQFSNQQSQSTPDITHSIDPSSMPSEVSTAEEIPGTENSTNASSFSLEPSQEDGPTNNDDPPPAYSFQANPDIFGFILMQVDTSVYKNRSSKVVNAPFYDLDHNILGYVELSESPRYSQRIITDVVRGWGIASLIGVVISTIIGYIVSRNLTKPLVNLESVASEMKDGNFEIRSPIYKPDELASLSDTFNQMAAHIQHSIETMRQFVSDAAHEIRTPLTSLRADLTLALTETSLKKAKPIIHRSLEQIDRLDSLSRDLLNLSKLESKNGKTKFKEIDLTHLLNEISEIYASAAEQAKVEFNSQLQQEPILINGDDENLRRAVGNLLANAVKFTPPGGIVNIKLYAESDSALILVEDDGIGILNEDREGLFNRFHRGKNTQNYPGAGLGLAISKAIVEKHNGIIGFLPDKEKTVFFIRLPLASKPTSTKEKDSSRSTRRAKRKQDLNRPDTPERL
ncbi:signal transduction histidine kinase [Pelolinea submarina]|uniref:histidine kinase n=1 Tax=Pelolinea submarina TaxID=913107 RepID=A0A3E0AJ73_9CHLR|nr:signal transduction histidine kinase [Pelolinea submarina]